MRGSVRPELCATALCGDTPLRKPLWSDLGGGIVFARIRNKVVILTTAVAIVVTTVGFTRQAVGQPPGIMIEQGVLRLHLGADSDYFRFDPADGAGGFSVGTVQPVGPPSGKCQLTVAGPLISLTAIGSIGIFDDGLGVRISGSQGAPCGQLNNTEQMSMALVDDPTRTDDELAGMVMDFGEVDVELKFDAVLQADLLRDGVLQDSVLLDCSPAGSDCGPDSADGDNFRWLLQASNGETFDQIVFSLIATQPNAAGSLEGGADGTAACVTASCDPDNPSSTPSLGEILSTNDSLFHIVQQFDGTLDCGQTITEGSGTTVPLAEVTRLDNTDGSACVPKPYNLDATAAPFEEVSFAPSGPAQSAAYLVTITFLPTTAEADGLHTGIDYDKDGSGAFVPVQWCEAVQTNASGAVIGATLPAGETYCIVSETTSVTGTGNTQTEWFLFGEDDPNFRPH